MTFAPGNTTQIVNIDVLGDTVREPDETFFVNLSAATNATIADGQGVGTIENDDGFDPNGDGLITIADLFTLLNFLFGTGALGGSGDANGDSATNVLDVFRAINFLFFGGPAPA